MHFVPKQNRKTINISRLVVTLIHCQGAHSLNELSNGSGRGSLYELRAYENVSGTVIVRAEDRYLLCKLPRAPISHLFSFTFFPGPPPTRQLMVFVNHLHDKRSYRENMDCIRFFLFFFFSFPGYKLIRKPKEYAASTAALFSSLHERPMVPLSARGGPWAVTKESKHSTCTV